MISSLSRKPSADSLSIAYDQRSITESKKYTLISKKEILDVLVQGCDERVFINTETNCNKYHLNPVEFETLLQRGSCTSSTLTPDSFSAAKAFLSKYDELNYESLLESQAQRLRKLVQNEFIDPFDIFFAPSEERRGQFSHSYISLYRLYFNTWRL